MGFAVWVWSIHWTIFFIYLGVISLREQIKEDQHKGNNLFMN